MRQIVLLPALAFLAVLCVTVIVLCAFATFTILLGYSAWTALMIRLGRKEPGRPPWYMSTWDQDGYHVRRLR